MANKLLIALAVAVLLQGVTVVGAQTQYNPTGLTWDANSEPDLAGYKVYEMAPGTSTYEQLGECTPDVTVFPFTGATPHTDGVWSWHVTAIDEAGNESGPSNTATAVFDAGPPAPPTGCTTTYD